MDKKHKNIMKQSNETKWNTTKDKNNNCILIIDTNSGVSSSTVMMLLSIKSRNENKMNGTNYAFD